MSAELTSMAEENDGWGTEPSYGPWVPGLVALAPVRSLHSPGTQMLRVPDERPRAYPGGAKIRDPGATRQL